MNISDVIAAILTGEFDSHLDRIFSATRDRQKSVRDIASTQLKLTLEIGDRIEIFNISPKYLSGAKGAITKIERDRGKGYVSIKLDSPVYKGKMWGKEDITGIPIVCLRKIEE
jgi:hypothetical protein